MAPHTQNPPNVDPAFPSPLPLLIQELLFWQHAHPQSMLHSVPQILPLPEISGDVTALVRRSLRYLILRHESLRIFFRRTDDLFQPHVSQDYEPDLRCFDTAMLPASPQCADHDLDHRERIRTVCAELMSRPFDLEHGPLTRFALVELPKAQDKIPWILIKVAHHSVTDGHSEAVFAHELTETLVAMAHNRVPNFPPAFPMSDFIRWQHETLTQTQDVQAAWKAELADLPEPVSFPGDRTLSAHHMGHLRVPISTQGIAAIQKCGAHASPVAVLGVALSIVLWRHTSCTDLVLGLVTTGRVLPEHAGVLGCCVNPLPLRLRLDPQASVTDLLRQASAGVFTCLERQAYPGAHIPKELGLRRSGERHPLFDVLLSSDVTPQHFGAEVLPETFFAGRRFGLSVVYQAHERSPQLSLEYDASSMSPLYIERLTAQLLTVLEAIDQTETSLAHISVLPPAQRALLDLWGRGPLYAGIANIPLAFRKTAAVHPTRTALRDDSESLSYAELDHVSDVLAASLCTELAPQSVVGVLLRPSVARATLMLALLKADMVVMPFDPAYPPERIRFMTEDAHCQRIYVDQELPPLGIPVHPAPRLDDMRTAAGTAQVSASDLPTVQDHNLAVIYYTSGTTGQPKGVPLPHQALIRIAYGMPPASLTSSDTVLSASSPGFDASVYELWGGLLKGCTVAIMQRDALLEPSVFSNFLLHHGVTAVLLTTSLFHTLAASCPEILRPLRVCVTGGETLQPALARRVMEACPGLVLFNGYGPTESCTFVTMHQVQAADLSGPIPIGRPIANTELRILDAHGLAVPLGATGELYIAGKGLSPGYLNRPELTATAFVVGADGQRTYRTGDLVRFRASGLVDYVGRRDAQIKLRGYRIEPGEVEAHINALATVHQCAVGLMPDAAGEMLLVAFVRAQTVLPDAWRTELRQIVPEYMIPSRFVHVEAIPLGATDKVDRHALRAIWDAASQRPEVLSNASGLPRIREIFAQVLHLPAESDPVSDTDDFFDLGGHSLSLMRLANALNTAFGVRPRLTDLFGSCTPLKIAELLNIRTTASHLPKHEPNAPLQAAASQKRLFILEASGMHRGAYSVPWVLHLHGAVDPNSLEHALMLLVERHEVLRLAYQPTSSGLQPIPAPHRPRLVRHAKTTLEQALLYAREEAIRPFDLQREAPLRASLLEIQDGVLLVVILHHIACDGWSLDLIHRDLAHFYTACVTSTLDTPTSAPPSFTLSDYARWMDEYLISPQGHADRAYWLEQEIPEPLALPLECPRPALPDASGGLYAMRLPKALTQALGVLARSHGASMFMLLNALVKTLLFRHTGQTHLATGCPMLGRPLEAFADVVGCFVNTVVLCDRLRPEMPFSEFLATVRDTCIHGMEHQLYPFDLLVEERGLPRDPSRNPLFDVWTALHPPQPKAPAFADLDATVLDIPTGKVHFDLGFHLTEDADGLTLLLEYRTPLFSERGAARLAERFLTLCHSIIADPHASLERLEIISPAEHARLRELATGPHRLPAPWTWLLEPLAAQVQRGPELKALLWSGRQRTYAELDAQSAALATTLHKRGIGAHSLVGIFARRGPELIVGIFAIVRAGAAYVPLAPDLPRQRLADMAADAELALVLCTHDLQAHAQALGRPLHVLENIGDETLPESPLVFVPPQPHDPAYVIFTSGSTGRPKGVMIEHAGIVNRIAWMQEFFPLGPGDTILHKTPITFDVSVWELFWWSWSGASLALLPPEEEKNPQAIIEAISSYHITVVHFVPSMLHAFLDYIETMHIDCACLTSLRYVFVSGEALPTALANRFNAHIHPVSGAQLHNLYGPTEASVDVTWHHCTPEQTTSVLPIGRPVPNTRVYVLDSTLAPVPEGVVGELCLAGVQVARGYLNRPDANARNFLPDPFYPQDRMYRTGDLGSYLPDGSLAYAGRMDHQVKIRGFRIELGEIEHALAACPGVAAAVVTTRHDHNTGNSELVAHLVRQPDLSATDLLAPQTLRATLRETLPAYMLPADCIIHDALPLTASGKADRKALAALARPQTSNASETPELPIHNTPGRGDSLKPNAQQPTLARMESVWRELLPDARFGPDDPFFEIGGNSLLLIRLHGLLHEIWPDRISIGDLFRLPTVRDMARHLSQTHQTAASTSPAPAAPDALIAPRAPGQHDTPGDIAIIGLALRLADYDDLDSFWQDLSTATDRVGDLPRARRGQFEDLLSILRSCPNPSQATARQAAYLENPAAFDPQRFKMPPRDAAHTEPVQRLLTETALRALENAGYGGNALQGRAVGVFAAASGLGIFSQALQTAFPQDMERMFTLNVPSNLATRLSYLKDWHGPAMVVDTACSSGLVAVHQACQALRAGECSLAVAAAASVILAPYDTGQRLAIDAASGRALVFDARADGTGMGEGAVALLLKPLAHALRDGDAIHAVVRGSAVTQDGTSVGMSAPNPQAQAQAISQAMAQAGIGASDLNLIEAHGTGTALGDPVEIAGLALALGHEHDPNRRIPIGSVKGNFGHLDACAGLLGLAKAVLCLRHGQAVPQPGFQSPNPKAGFDTAPVFVPQALTPLRPANTRLHAGVSAFGMSGINCHVVLGLPEQPEQPDLAVQEKAHEPVTTPSAIPLLLSASSRAGLQELAQNMAQTLECGSFELRDIAWTLAHGRDHLSYRLGFCARSVEEARDLLRQVGHQSSTPHIFFSPNAASLHGSVAIDQHAALQAHPRDDAADIVQLFVHGQDISTPLHAFFHQPGNRLHLPGAPMERHVLWPDFRNTALAWLTPLGHGPHSTLFALPLEHPQFWPVHEHRVQQTPTLVGMALPQLALEVLNHGNARPRAPFQPFVLEDVAWRRPLHAGAPAVAERITTGAAQRIAVGSLQDGQWIVCTEAKIGPNAPSPVPLDIKALGHAHSVDIPVDHVSDRDALVQVSPRWDCLRGLSRTPDGLSFLGRLHLPEGYTDASGSGLPCALSPAMLDVAASLALSGPLVPAACTRMDILGPLPESCWALVQVRERDALTLSVDLTLLTDQGNAVLQAHGLTFMAPVRTLLPAPTLLCWEPRALQASPSAPKTLVCVGDASAQELAQIVRKAGIMTSVYDFKTARAENFGTHISGSSDAILFVAEAGPESGHAATLTLATLLGRLTGTASPPLVVISRRGFAVHPTDIPTPEQALLCGPALAAPCEDPKFSCRVLDVDELPTADMLVAELTNLTPGPQLLRGVCAIRAKVRYERQLHRASSVAPVPVFRANTTQVISGGLGAMALALARKAVLAGAKVALLYRGPGPDDRAELKTVVAELRSLGEARLLFVSADVTDPASLSTALHEIRTRWGRIDGVIHTAGVAGRGILATKSPEAFMSVLAPKVAGTRLLHDLTLEDRPELFMLASSLTALSGAAGQADYAGANAFLDSFAAWRRAQGLPALSINWPALSNAGMAVKNHVNLSGQDSICDHDVPDLVDLAAAQGAAQVVFPPADLTLWHQTSATAHSVARETQNSTLQNANAPHTPRTTGDLAQEIQTLTEIWQEVLGYTDLDPDADFYELGGDSIHAMQILNRFKDRTGRAASVAELLEHSSVRALATALWNSAAQNTHAATSAVSTLTRVADAASYPLTAEQLGMYLLESRATGTTAFNLPNVLHSDRAVDPDELERALAQVIARHDVLRMSIHEVNSEPAMVISDHVPFQLERLRVTEAELHARCAELVRPFDLRQAPLLRATLLDVEGEKGRDSLLFVDVHHIAADAQTMHLLVQEIESCYAAQPPMPLYRYRDFTVYLHDLIQGETGTRELRYWRDKFNGSIPEFSLPTDRPRPPAFTFRGDTVSLTLEAEAFRRIKDNTKKLRVTLFNLVLGAAALVLSRSSRQSRVSLGLADSGRFLSEVETMPGLFVNVLPLLLDVDENVSLQTYLEQTLAEYSTAMAHNHLGLRTILAALDLPLPTDRTPLAEVTLSYMHFADTPTQQHALGLRYTLAAPKTSCKNDLTIFVLEGEDSLTFSLEYYAEIFDRTRMQRLAEELSTVLQSFATTPAAATDSTLSAIQPLRTFPLMKEQEKNLLLHTWSGQRSVYPKASSLFALFMEQSVARPEHPAVLGSGREDSYATLRHNALRAAASLLGAGIKPGEYVALFMDRSPDSVAAMLGIVAAGAAYVPCDTSFNAERIAFMFQDANIAVCLADAAHVPALRAAAPNLLILTPEMWPAPCPEALLPSRNGTDVVYVIYTSGTTGRPKGVRIPHRAVTRLVVNTSYIHITPADRLLHISTPAFDAATFELWGALLNGASILTATKDEVLELATLERMMRQNRASIAFFTTGLFHHLAHEMPQILGTLRVACVGGEVLRPEALRRVRAACPNLTITHVYGPTENTTYSTACHCDEALDHLVVLPIGRPITNTTARILDPYGNPVPIGIWGELHLGGDGLALDYLNLPELTASRFIPDPWATGERLYRSGDIARWREDGMIDFRGREDDQIKLRGFRIELGEVLQALHQAPGVAQAAPIILGQDDQRTLAACIVPVSESLNAQAIRDHLAASLPAFMHPSPIAVARALPLTRNGKVDQARLAEIFSTLPLLHDDTATRSFSEQERRIANILVQVLGAPVPRPDSSFFDLGGHSLLAAKAVNAITTATGVSLTLGEFFNAPTAAGLAALIAHRDTSYTPIPPAPEASDYPISDAQARLYVLQCLHPQGTAYSMPFVLEFTPELNVNALCAALNMLVARHESLRTEFFERHGEPRQRIVPSTEALSVDIQHATWEAMDAALSLRIHAEIALPFDLRHAPLMRVRLWTLPHSVCMLLVLHHIIADGWSMGVFLRELSACYAALSHDETPRLPEPGLRYRDYAVWAATQDFSAHARAAGDVLRGAPAFLPLPTDFPVPAERSGQGGSVEQLLSAEQTQRLRHAAQTAGVPLSSLMLAVFAVLLQRLTRQEDVVIGLGASNRHRPELETMIGFLVNILPLRLRLEDDAEFGHILNQTHQAVTEALTRQEYPLDCLLRDLDIPRGGTRQPLVNVSYSFHGFRLGSALADLPLVQPTTLPPDILGIRTSKFDLTLFVHDDDETLRCEMEYDTDILLPVTVQRWMRLFATFANAIATPAPDISSRTH